MASLPLLNWPAAFTAYCHGVPHEEICQVYGMTLQNLIERVHMENWAKLRASLPIGEALPGSALERRPSAGQAKLTVLLENRQTNLAIWAKLRDDLLDVVDRLRSGKLKLERQWHSKGVVTRANVDPSIIDRVALATYARTVSEGTYRALGDFTAQEKVSSDATTASTAASAPTITIILPGVIAAPRDQRHIEGQVIDLTPLAQNLEAIPVPVKLDPKLPTQPIAAESLPTDSETNGI